MLPGDVNQLTINAGLLVDVRYASKRPLVLTVPRALSRIHRITKFTVKSGDRAVTEWGTDVAQY
ncbi:hypothetical protein EAMG_01733 [Escherichia coli M056]|nr:hypothetical protein EAMG_01733 [Escherichia coli M056]